MSILNLCEAICRKIGKPERFTGRKHELTFHLKRIERIKQESSLSSAILSRRKTGKTALLQRLYNHTIPPTTRI
ncbi:MAG: hypothetical protein GY801_47235 [bacterium]|nr:hypothetical protein [bacterium]